MKNDTEKLIQRIDILIESLEKTENPAIKFFKGAINVIQKCKSEKELKQVLDDHLIHSGRVKDYGGFNREQCDLFDKMWETANSIYEGI